MLELTTLLSDIINICAMIIIWYKIWKSKSVYSGISGKSQMLFALVYSTRYIVLITMSMPSSTHFPMQILLFISYFATCFSYFTFRKKYDYSLDTFRIEFLIAVSFIVSLCLTLLIDTYHQGSPFYAEEGTSDIDFEIFMVLYFSSILLEMVAMWPQFYIIYKTRNIENMIRNYLLVVGLSWILFSCIPIYRGSFIGLVKLLQTIPFVILFFLCIGKVVTISKGEDSWYNKNLNEVHENSSGKDNLIVVKLDKQPLIEENTNSTLKESEIPQVHKADSEGGVAMHKLDVAELFKFYGYGQLCPKATVSKEDCVQNYQT